jgi:hypothetical protein
MHGFCRLGILAFFISACGEPVADVPDERRRMIERNLELMFELQDVDGDIDINGVLDAFYRLNAVASREDLPLLLHAMRSPRNNFWTRELLSEPIARLGGSAVLEPLFVAFAANVEEGHDNDGFAAFLIQIAETDPEGCIAECNRLLALPSFQHGDLAKWLLTFTNTGHNQAATVQPDPAAARACPSRMAFSLPAGRTENPPKDQGAAGQPAPTSAAGD